MNKYFAYLDYDFSDVSDIRIIAEIRENCKYKETIISEPFERSTSFINRLKKMYDRFEYEFNVDL